MKTKIEKVMDEFKTGELHSGSKKGPLVKSRAQAIAIGLSEAGLTRNMKRSVRGSGACTMEDLRRGHKKI